MDNSKLDANFLFNEKVILAMDSFAAGNNLSFYYDIADKNKHSYLYDMDVADQKSFLRDDSLKLDQINLTGKQDLSTINLTQYHNVGSELFHCVVDAFKNKEELPEPFFYYIGRVFPLNFLLHEFQKNHENFFKVMIHERHPQSLGWENAAFFLKAYRHATQWCNNDEEKTTLLLNALQAHKKDFKSVQNQKIISDFIHENIENKYQEMFHKYIPDSILAKNNPLVQKLDCKSLLLTINRATIYHSNILNNPDMKRYEGLLDMFEKITNLQHVKKQWGIYKVDLFEKSTKEDNFKLAFYLEKDSPLTENLAADMIVYFLQGAQHNGQNDVFTKSKAYLLKIMDKYHLNYKLKNDLIHSSFEDDDGSPNVSSGFKI
jgi:hypothetical protein